MPARQLHLTSIKRTALRSSFLTLQFLGLMIKPLRLSPEESAVVRHARFVCSAPELRCLRALLGDLPLHNATNYLKPHASFVVKAVAERLPCLKQPFVQSPA